MSNDTLIVKALAAKYGAKADDLIKRLELADQVALSVASGKVGFRGGWVSSSHLETNLHPRFISEVLAAMGYHLHPALADRGRTNCLIHIDGAKRSRLFVNTERPERDEAVTVREYLSAQMSPLAVQNNPSSVEIQRPSCTEQPL